MKSINLLFLFLISGLFSAQAQITITRANMPAVGEQYIFSTSQDQIDVKGSGPNHNWDFSNIKPAQNDTFIYKKPSDISLIYSFAFSGSIALKQPGGFGGGQQGSAYQFFKNSATTFSQVGMGINVIAADLPIKYTDEDEIYHFPLEFKRRDSTTFAANTEIPGFGKISIKGTRVTIVDGWGKVKTPYKTYNCLRVRSVIKEVDSFNGQVIRNDRLEFKWLSLDEKIPVMQVIGNIVNGQFVQQAVMYRDIYREIINPDAPKANFIAKDTVIFEKETVAFANLSTGMQNQYFWTFTPNTVTFTGGTTATSENPVVTFNAAGKYTVSLRAVNRDGSNQKVKNNYIEVKTKTSAINELNYFENINIYPNPSADGLINIKLPENMINENFSLKVIDIFGREVKTVNVKRIDSGPRIELDLKQQPKGIYILSITNSFNNFSKRIILE